MKTQNVGFILIRDSSKKISGSLLPFALNNTSSYCAITDNTSMLILLNSSKHAQAPALARPLKNFATMIWSIPSEQLNTTHYLAKALARSLVDSVFPVPAGPAGAPPKLRFNAPIRVI